MENKGVAGGTGSPFRLGGQGSFLRSRERWEPTQSRWPGGRRAGTEDSQCKALNLNSLVFRPGESAGMAESSY